MAKRWTGLAAVAALGLLLAGCLLLPGKFGSDLSVRKDGTFSFSYKGEIYLMALSKLAAEQEKAKQAKSQAQFEPSTCYDEQTIEERPCTREELAKQRQDWDDVQQTGEKSRQNAGQNAGMSKSKNDEEMMKAMLGGIDPSDPKAAQEFAERLRRQQGWKSIIDRGDGKFEVEYAISGRLDHDFSFPTIERMPVITPFVTLIRRNDGTVRIDAPAFSSGASASPMMGMAAAMSKDKGSPAGMPELDGTFTLTTDADVLANNTDEGPQADPAGKRLNWHVNARTAAAPTALLRLGK